MLLHHYETRGMVPVEITQVFQHLDDHTRLSSHMSQSSWRMGGGRMAIGFDEFAGRRVGSKISLSGRVLGLALSVDEVVTEREPPRRKTWETVGTPRLLVIDHYRLGFDITPHGSSSSVRVFIDYDLPHKGIQRLLGLLFGRYYAKWCTEQMLRDVRSHFAARSRQRDDLASI